MRYRPFGQTGLFVSELCLGTMTFGGGEGIWQQIGALAVRGQLLLFDSIGATLWVAVGLALGWLFSPAIEDIVATLSQWGGWGLMLVAVAVALVCVHGVPQRAGAGSGRGRRALDRSTSFRHRSRGSTCRDDAR